MKSADNENSSNNWLGFSLSPQITMEQETHLAGSNSSSGTTVVPNNYFNYSSFSYGVEGENGGFHAPLSFMPLKSDGSLCIMEALNRSQSQGLVTSSTPKLEDFFGGARMASLQYDHDVSMNSIHQNFKQQQQQPQQQHYPFFTGYSIDEQNKQPHVMDCSNNVQRQPFIDVEAGLKNWESGSMGVMGFGDLKSLSLSMSPGSQSSCVTASHHVSPSVVQTIVTTDAKKRGSEKMEQKQIFHRKTIDTFGQRTSQYRGVTRHRWTGRYEAHLWDNSCKKEGQTRKGRQVYLGGYDMEEKAARAYDQAALKYWGPSTHINFPVENYEQELEGMKNMSRQEFVAHLRRKSSGFSRGASIYRGVTRHHQHGRWQARIGRVAGNKDLYLGTFSTQEEAAEAYDIAAIRFRGANAVTNFDISKYNVESIIASSTLLSGEAARRNKDAGVLAIANEAPSSSKKTGTHLSNASSIVPSLNSSREASPDKSSSIMPILFALPPSSSTKDHVTTTSINTWVQSTQLRPPISLPHLPMFAAWTDA